MLAGAARARAALEGRDYVIPDDVKALAPALLRHRVILSPAAEIEGRQVEEVVAGDHRDDRGAALIYPTRPAVLATAAGAPVALAVAALAPGRWFAGAGLAVGVVLLRVVDALLRRGGRSGARSSSCPQLGLCRRRRRGLHASAVRGRRPSARSRGWRSRMIAAGRARERRAGAVPLDGGRGRGPASPVELLRRGRRGSSGCGCAGAGRSGLVWKQRTRRARERACRSCPTSRAARATRARASSQRHALKG